MIEFQSPCGDFLMPDDCRLQQVYSIPFMFQSPCGDFLMPDSQYALTISGANTWFQSPCGDFLMPDAYDSDFCGYSDCVSIPLRGFFDA